MIVLSLCDGMSCGRMALEKLNIPIEKYFASEIKDIAIKNSMENFPDNIQIGDVNKISYSDGVLHTPNGDFETNIDLVIFGSPCFAKGTLVLAQDGYKEIQDIKIGDYVLAHDNKMHKVTNSGCTGEKNIYEVKCQGAEIIRTTSNHKFYVRENKSRKTWKKENRGKTIREFGEPEWKTVEFLKDNKNYFVGYAINQESKLPEWNGIELYKYRKKYVSNTLPLDNKDFWYIVGRYLGDGWICKNYKKSAFEGSRSKYTGIKICCNKNEADELQDAIEKVFHVSKTEERTATRFHIYCAELAYFLEQFGVGAKNKFVPNFVMDLPIELLEAFLKGYFDADGCYLKDGKMIQYTTISRNLAYGIEQCIAKVYHRPCSLTHSQRPKEYVIEGRKVNQNDTYIVRFSIDAHPTQIGAFYEDGYMWCPIRSIEETSDVEDVYDITVEEAHSFTANGIIVHNCQSFSNAMKKDKRIGLEDKERSGLFLECHRILNEVKPKYFLMENVVMKKDDQQVITDMLGVKPVRINSSLLTAQLRDRLYWTNIPNVTVPEDQHITLSDILIDGYTPKAKAHCLLKNDSHGYYNGCGYTPVKRFFRWYYRNFTSLVFPTKEDFEKCLEIYNKTIEGKTPAASLFDDYKGTDFDCLRFLWKEERARLQGVPEEYVKNLSEQDAADLLGDGWTVPVIVHLFKGLQDEYSLKEKD